jgi:heme-degrading monooxygenase HmoA
VKDYGSIRRLRTKLKGAQMSLIAKTPKPPYYAVIFTSLRTEGDNGYAQMADNMVELAQQQPGFLGIETAREDVGITVSYWSDLESIKQWKANLDHQQAQRLGREKWYSSFKARISKVERDYGV